MTDAILVVAAHPDDECLGPGGTIARHADDEDAVNVLILAEGATARDGKRDPAARSDELSDLRAAAAAAAEILGSEIPRFAGLPDNRLDGVDLLDVIKQVEAAVADVRPRIVYTHHAGDLNVDHKITHQAVITACRPLPGSPVKAIYAFETPSSTEWAFAQNVFRPTRFVDISTQLSRKCSALACYRSEMRDFPHARSLEAVQALACLRGAAVGLEAAEAFEVIREIL